MRPRRRILLIDAREDRRGITRFVLETVAKFTVLPAASVYEASEIAHSDDPGPDVLLGYWPVSDEYLMEVAGALKLPWVFIAPDSVTGKVWPSMAAVLERVKLAAVRRRGPEADEPVAPYCSAIVGDSAERWWALQREAGAA